MFDTIKNYLIAVKFLLETEDGTNLARLLSLRDSHANDPHLQVELPDTLVKSLVAPPFDNIFVEHIKVLFYMSRSRK